MNLLKNLPDRLIALSPLALALASCGDTAPGDNRTGAAATSTAMPFTVKDVATFDEPWALTPDPAGDRLFVTERAGRIGIVLADGTAGSVSGVPPVDYGGQGGLGDFVFLRSAPGTAASTGDTVFLSWVEAGSGDTRGAVVGKAQLVCVRANTCALERLRVIWRQAPKVTGRGHFSHRIAVAPDGASLFVASGERQKFSPAQDLTVNLGKIVHLDLDGKPVPAGPFAGRGGASDEVWTLGHRNILGLAFDAAGRLWDLEHGPRGGDELNLIERGKNYGWPVVSNGDNYDGTPIPRHATRPDFAAPAISWNPVIAPGNFIFVSSPQFPQWRGNALIAGLGSEGLVRVAIRGTAASEEARYPLGRRIRAVAQAANGAIYAIEDGKNARLLKLTPR